MEDNFLANISIDENMNFSFLNLAFFVLLVVIIIIALYVIFNYVTRENNQHYNQIENNSHNNFINNDFNYPQLNPKQKKENINNINAKQSKKNKKSTKPKNTEMKIFSNKSSLHNSYNDSINNNLNNINNNINNNMNNNINNNIFDLNIRNDLSFSKSVIIPPIMDYQEIDQLGYLASQIYSEPKTGLANIGATCYMNATLQCLSHTIKLVNFFLDPRNGNAIYKKQLSKELLEVFKRLWIKSYNNNKNDYEPYQFKNTISEMNELFAGIAANDAKDLISFILQELHNELNLANNNDEIINNNTQMNGNFIFQDQTNENQMFLSFMNEFKNTQKSIISDLFFFIIMTKTECLNCKQMNMNRGIYVPRYLYNFQIMNFLIFPLETVREYKCAIYNQNFTEVNLIDCFIHYQKVELMQGENMMWCKYCNQNAVSQYMTTIYSPPTYLVLILNRGKGNCFNIKINFEEILDIGNFVKMKESKYLRYQLYAIVTHIGPSSMGGHFIAFCRSPIDSSWYRFNDSMVNYEGNFYNIRDFGVPYILFYEKQN